MPLRRLWQRMGSARLRLGCLGVLLVCLGGLYSGPVSQAAADGLTPAALAMYYGWPSLVNRANGNTAMAAAVFGQYQVVVFGAGLEESDHGDHVNSAEIIAILHRDYHTRVFGYMDATLWSRSSASWQEHVDFWAAMGVDGILVDRFGYDWAVTRAIQNQILDTIHARNLRAFVNSWHIDHTFSSSPDPRFPSANPAGIPSHILATDMYMFESFVIIEGNYAPCQQTADDSWLQKADKAFAYRQVFGTTIWAATTADRLTQAVARGAGWDTFQEGIDPRLSYAWYASAMYGFDGFGWTEPQFSAGGSAMNLLPWRTRPVPNPVGGIGTYFLENVQHAGETHSRRTDLGLFRVVCRNPSTYLAEFLVDASPTATWTPTSTRTPTQTVTPARTLTPTATPTRTPSMTPSPTATPTATSSPTTMATPSPTATATVTRTPTLTLLLTATGTPTQATVPTFTITPTTTPLADSDGDGMPDIYEAQHACLSSTVNDVDENPDGDSYRNIQEYRLRTDPCMCNPAYDWNGDGEVAVSDVLYMVSRWGETSANPAWVPELDVDGDGVISVVDFVAVINHMGARCD